MGSGDRQFREGIGDADGVCRVHQVRDLSGVRPADGDCLGAVGVGCVEGVAAEDERDDSGVEVLVDASQSLDLDVDAGLLADLAADAFLELLAEFEDTARAPSGRCRGAG